MQKSLNIEKTLKTECSGYTPQETSLEHKTMFDIMFVHNDEEQSVEVVESSTIDFNAIIEQLREGNSIFIAPKIQMPPQKNRKHQRHRSYINHV
jgi:hypothetical protein